MPEREPGYWLQVVALVLALAYVGYLVWHLVKAANGG